MKGHSSPEACLGPSVGRRFRSTLMLVASVAVTVLCNFPATGEVLPAPQGDAVDRERLSDRQDASYEEATLAQSGATSSDQPWGAPDEVGGSPGNESVAYVSVNFTGKNVADHWARLADSVVEVVTADDNLKDELYRSVRLGSRSSLCEVYQEELGLPGCSSAVIDVATSLNPTVLPADPDFLIVLPNLPLETSRWGKVFDTSDDYERSELARYQSAWSDISIREYEVGEVVRASFPGYVMEVELEPAAALGLEIAFFDSEVPRANISRGPGEVVDYSYVSPDEHARSCQSGGPLDPAEKGLYSLLLGAPYRAPTCEGDTCPAIVLVDRPVYRHAGLEEVLLLPGEVERNGTPPSGSCDFAPRFVRELHHGTHLAGIMAARDGPKSQFVGLAQDAVLYNEHWADDANALARRISEDLVEGEPTLKDRHQVWVFASRFKFNQRWLRNGSLPSADTRLRTPDAAQRLLNEQLLWVTAIGQADPVRNIPRRSVERTTPLSPMNLGDQDNVVVVTACEQCTGESAGIWPEAFTAAPDLVNVAAPGGLGIPGLATTNLYVTARGTSQSAAYVGGVAASMLAEYPRYYGHRAFRVKRRLMVTAEPLFGEGNSVGTGIVDPVLALCDPTEHWLQYSGSGVRPGEKRCGLHHRLIKEVKWCSASLDLGELGDDADVPSYLPLLRSEKVQRIRKVYASPTLNKDRWVLYSDESDEARRRKTNIVKYGPALPHSGDPLIASVVFSDGVAAKLRLSEIEDLLLARSVSSTESCGS